MRKIFLFGAALALACTMHAKTVRTLDIANPLSPATVTYDASDVWTETYNEDDYETIDYQSISFNHTAWAGYNFWYGFTIAKCQDTTFSTMSDQFHCVAGGGLAGKGTPYLLAYAAEGMSADAPCQTYFDGAYVAKEVYLCTGSWAMHNMTVGGAGHTFAAGDSLVIVIEGLDENYDAIAGKKITFFLADYRSSNPSDWKLNRGWEKCDLSPLGEVYGLAFTMKTSDAAGGWSNTALYFALDGLKIEHTEIAGFENADGDVNLTTPESAWQGADEPTVGKHIWSSGDYSFASYTAGWGYNGITVSNETTNTSTGSAQPYRSTSGGAYAGSNFAVWNDPYSTAADVTFEAQVIPGFFINNNAYTVTSMLNGDSYAKKFGKEDWLVLYCIGMKGGEVVDTVSFYLAQNGEYVNQWTYVDLSPLGEVDGIRFYMWGNDIVSYDGGTTYYLNTPAYFCMDNFGAAMPAGYIEPARAKFPESGTALDEAAAAAAKAQKVLRGGAIYILRDGKLYDITGRAL